MQRLCPLPAFRQLFCSSLVLLAAVLFLLPGAWASAPTGLEITQVYGGGGNAGATYIADFVELYNPTGANISTAGYSVQYSSSGGTTISFDIALTAQTLFPGQHFLLAGPAGSAGAPLPAPDETSNMLVMSSSAGKVYLVNTTTLLPAACPATNSTIVDFIAYGLNTNCSYTAAAPAPSATTADLRTTPCVVSGNNSTEYTASTPVPRNSSSGVSACPSGPLSLGTAASPSSLNTGSSTLLTVAVSANGTSTGVTVTADLSALYSGGSTAQRFYDDGATGGDVTANDKTFSFTATVTNAGTFTIPVTASDSQGRSGTGTISVTASTPPPTIPIRTIQSAKPSNYLGQRVTTSGIVIGVAPTFFYLESKDADVTPSTPEGIQVFTSSAPPASVVVGAEIQVSGTVTSFPASTVSATPDTEITSPTAFTLLSSGNTLPTPVKITASLDSASGGIYQFTKYEGMRVAIDTLTATSGTAARMDLPTETATSLGQFYGVVAGVARPFRETGISITDLTYGAHAQSIPSFDSNPELLLIDSVNFSKNGTPAAIDTTAGATLTSISGVMDFTFGAPRIILDAANRPSVTGLKTAQPLPARTAQEFTVGSFELDQFYTSDAAAAKNTGSTVIVLTAEAYQRRLAKASLAIRNVLNSPDILAVQEAQDLAVLQDLATKISTDAKAANQSDPAYTPYLFLATDATGVNTGLLVQTGRVTVTKVEQIGLNATYADASGTQQTLNDRTPIVLHAGIKRAPAADYPVTVINIHARSLNGVDDPTDIGKSVRLKREAQAEYLASLIQSYQSGGEHVVTVGNFNAFQFSDGFVDSLGVVLGTPVPASQVVTPPASGLTQPTLVDAVTLLAATEQESYVDTGNAEVLDHVVVTKDILPTRLAYGRINADFPGIYLNDATRPEQSALHDPIVAYFAIPSGSGTTPPATPVITWNPSATSGFKGVALGAGVLDATSTAPGSFAYTATIAGGSPVAITASSVLAVGGYTLTANFTPADSSAYTTASATVAFTVLNQQVFVINSGGSLASYFHDGSAQTAPTSGGGIGAAVDATGSLWSINANVAGVTRFNDAGVVTASFTDPTITSASALAIDGQGQVWIANAGSLTALSNAGVAVFANPVATQASLSSPASLQIDTAGSLWIANPANNTVVEVIGAAAPAIAPTVTAVINATPGTRP